MNNDQIRAKMDELMDWEPGSSNSFSMRAMQTFIRGKDSKFDQLLAEYLDMGEHLYGEPMNEPDFRDAECPHGCRPGDCKYCDVESDLAYDAWREDQRKNF
jgi:hypothetical protein